MGVKRSFLNAREWYEFIEHKVIPKFDTDPAAAKENMANALAALKSDSNEGIDHCKAVIVQRQIASGKHKMAMSNAFSNAKMHGEAQGPVDISVELNANGELLISIVNQPGPKHEENKWLQALHGPSHLLKSTKKAESDVGSRDSTFLGCSEIQRSVDLMGAAATLDFDAAVTFMLTMKMIVGPDECDAMQLPEGTVLIFFDDDKLPRIQ